LKSRTAFYAGGFGVSTGGTDEETVKIGKGTDSEGGCLKDSDMNLWGEI